MRTSSLPSRFAGIRLPEGIPLLVVHGSAQFVTDRYVAADLRVMELDEVLWEWLKAEGFRRIIVNRRSRPAFCHDEESERLLRPEPGPPPQAPRMSRFRGPLGDVMLPAAQVMAAAGRPLARTATSSLTDLGAIELMDTAMRDGRARTALIFAEAEQWLSGNEAPGRFADALGRWTESPGVARTLCVLVFRQRTVDAITEFVERLAAYPALHALLASIGRDATVGRYTPGVFSLGPPARQELTGLLHLYRLTCGLRVADWRELPAIERTLVAAQSSIKDWQYRFGDLAVERVPLSLARLREWVPASTTDIRGAWARLEAMTGLTEVKASIRQIADYAQNQARLHEVGLAGEPAPDRLNFVFSGNPGTGKTTVARLLGEILREIGLLPVGHVHEMEPSQMIAAYVGHTRRAMEEAVAAARGGVLFIDEAYQLSDDKSGFGAEAITTLVQLMERERGKFAVIIAGYPDKLAQFLRANPGLQRRFPEHNRIDFPDFGPGDLLEILLAALRQRGLRWTDALHAQLGELVSAMAAAPGEGFGNAGEMENVAEALHRRWSSRVGPHVDQPVDTADMPPAYQGHLTGGKVPSADDIKAELADFVGLAGVKEALGGLADELGLALRRRDAGLKTSAVEAPHLLFVGPPGTGKTSVAKLAGRLFAALHLLRRGHLVSVTRADLVGGYQGQTAPRTREKVLDALDGVLFIDEAYSLAMGPEDMYGYEAVNELTKQMEEYRGRLVVIAAGYPREMERFLGANPGLRSRFAEPIEFSGYSSSELVQILRALAAREDFVLPEGTAARAADWLSAERARQGRDFGNARAAGRLLERMKGGLSRRLNGLGDPGGLGIDLLRRFEPEDVPDAWR